MNLTHNDSIGPLRSNELGDYAINFVSYSRRLGFMIDKKLSWGHAYQRSCVIHGQEGEATA